MPPRKRPTPAAKTATSTTAPPPLPEGAPKPGHPRYLAPKDAELFRQALQLYETKSNTKGLEVTTDILTRYPHHGETLSMRGIFLHSLGRKEQGYAEIQRGVKKDLDSHIVWHVYALMRRADKDFEEALKCYKKACEIEKDSLNLLTDLATLTIHLRRYSEYVTVRQNILKSQPRLRRNWLALAVAQFLARQHADACRTLSYYENMLREVPEGEVEMGEVLLFHAQVLEEAGEYEKCVEFLGEKSGQIVDKTEYSVLRARLLLKLGRTESALWAWEVLLEENPESQEYIRATVQAKGADCDATTPEEREKAVSVLDELAEKCPRSQAIKRLALDLSSGETFRQKATSYLLTSLRKGIPSLFADIKALYKLPNGEGAEKAKVVGEIVERFRKELEEKGAVVTDELGEDDSVDSPSTYLWTLYFLSSHHSHPLNPSSSQPLALSTLSKADSHTPSLPELSMLRARILKRAGDVQGAARAMEHAREMDGQDRFLNSKAAKYMIRAGEWERAEKIVGLFTKKDAPSPLEDLVEMQCLWFLQEEGDSYAQAQDWGRALKRYHQILDIFQEVEEDQYDFHSYCMRKSTLKAYVELLRFEDKLRDHPRFAAAASGAIRIYLSMHDDPSSFPTSSALTNGDAAGAEVEKKAEEEEEEEKGKKDKEEREKKEQEEKGAAAAGAAASGADKKGKNKKKDKGKKAAEPKKDAAPAAAAATDDEEPPNSNVYTDADPSGATLLQTGLSTPLTQARLFLSHLIKLSPASSSAETQILAAEVAIREGKLLEALKAVRTAREIEPESSKTIEVTVRLARAISESASSEQGGNAAVSAVLATGLSELIGGGGGKEVLSLLSAWVDEQLHKYGAREGAKEEWILAAAQAKRLAGVNAEEVVPLVMQLVQRQDVKPSLEQLSRAYTLLRSLDSAEVESFRTSAAQRFSLARAFKTDVELEALDAQVQTEDKAESGEEKEVVE